MRNCEATIQPRNTPTTRRSMTVFHRRAGSTRRIVAQWQPVDQFVSHLPKTNTCLPPSLWALREGRRLADGEGKALVVGCSGFKIPCKMPSAETRICTSRSLKHQRSDQPRNTRTTRNQKTSATFVCLVYFVVRHSLIPLARKKSHVINLHAALLTRSDSGERFGYTIDLRRRRIIKPPVIAVSKTNAPGSGTAIEVMNATSPSDVLDELTLLMSPRLLLISK